MKAIFIPVMLSLGLPSGIMAQTSSNNSTAEQEILALGREIVDALNKTDLETLSRDFLESDSTLFVIDGMRMSGHDKIVEGLYSIPKRRKSIVVEVLSEDVLMLSEDMGVHILEFSQLVTTYEMEPKPGKGVWTTIYKKVNGEWKIMMVHESHQIE